MILQKVTNRYLTLFSRKEYQANTITVIYKSTYIIKNPKFDKLQLNFSSEFDEKLG